MQRTIRARLCFGNAAMMGFVMFSCTDSQNKYTQNLLPQVCNHRTYQYTHQHSGDERVSVADINCIVCNAGINVCLFNWRWCRCRWCVLLCNDLFRIDIAFAQQFRSAMLPVYCFVRFENFVQYSICNWSCYPCRGVIASIDAFSFTHCLK